MWKKWWLLHATDFQSLMYPCFIISRILGMFPYKISASTFDASKPWYTLSTIVICICGIYDITLIHTLIYKVNFGEMTKNLQAILYYMCSSFIIIITHILSVPRMRLLQTILKISKLPSKSYENLSKFIHIKDILGTIFVIVQIYIYIPKTEMFNSLNSLTRVLTAYQVVMVFQTNMLYINCVYVLKACFKNINDNLTYIQRLMVNDTRPLCVFILMGNIKRSLLIELKALKKRHLMLNNTVQIMNIVFSLQLLATIITIFSITTFELYFYIVHWQDGILIISFNNPFFDKFLMTIIHHFIQMMLLMWICETGKKAQQIHITIHNLLNNTK